MTTVDLFAPWRTCATAIREIRLSDGHEILNDVEVVIGARPLVRDLLITLVRARVDDPNRTAELLDALMMTDAHAWHVEHSEHEYTAGAADTTWDVAFDRAAAERDAAEQELLAFLAERTCHRLDSRVVELKHEAARALGAQLLLLAEEASDRRRTTA